MVSVIGVRFRYAGKIYYFDPAGIDLKLGEKVIVETARGIECGEVVQTLREVDDSEVVAPLKKVIRKATEEDLQHVEENKRKAKEAFGICLEKIKKHNLEMKLIDVEYTFDNNKILFYFTADGRVDFRELVKDLAAVFRTRIELRQIGVRDEAKMMGGLGVCGRCLCCCNHLTEFQPISIKMAKGQSLSLNPTKISGICGRLMCCLRYEHEVYEDLLKRIPKVNALVQTPDGPGTVVYVSLLQEKVKVKLDNDNEPDLKEYHASEVKLLKDAEKESEEQLDEADMELLKQLED
ncbi:stage 0 sporulation protein [Thermoclostridium stercorarium subsp. leptospartum DSM 9219]|jgi:cell fate regulator YaaT (PSP1 superfamily)|uniref:Stage 0 sporulation protein n=1 Tax=Thermoclostridium stercorarium subsp. leptospartum DSM 9219 TaxID=1346611 RepID=A0A1B1YK25_THEST|nr:stage 0 sporulation family protein [Thermoclostridium stercorarium]ANX01138.1 stage 0 sporulation protein [Thermoclostridium stercorarium subsp. leptospartum DSM 9219]